MTDIEAKQSNLKRVSFRRKSTKKNPRNGSIKVNSLW